MKSLNAKRAEKMELHHELTDLAMFNASDENMEKDIGRRCTIIDPKYPIEHGLFTVQGVQYIFDGSLAYRIVGDADVHGFGRPARKGTIKFIS